VAQRELSMPGHAEFIFCDQSIERTSSWHNAHKKVVWCTERRGRVVVHFQRIGRHQAFKIGEKASALKAK